MANLTGAENTELLYQYLYGDVSGKIVLYSNIVVSSLVGPILMIGIVIFEMFGGDSQKRTIVNRLLSALLINTAIWSFLLGITKASRDIVGLLDYKTALFLQISARLFSNTAYIFYNVLTIIRYLFIVVWKRMRGFQDKFWSSVFCLSAYTLSIWFNIVFIMTGFHPDQDLLIRITKNTTENVVPDSNNSTHTNR